MRKVYLDNAATTPVHPKVLKVMLPYLKEIYGNPSSFHDFGERAKKGIEKARSQVANLIGASPEEIIFTSSGTESNNWALKGIAQANSKKGNHIIVSQIEHFSVLHPAKALEKAGFEVSYLPVNRYGLVDPTDIEKKIKKETILISVMFANGEIGTIEPIKEIGKIARERGVCFHTDAVQAAGIVPIDVNELQVDLLSLSSHQFYGPKGIGALFVRKGVRILPFIEGGIQEDGKRAGTENVAGIVGFGKAAELAKQELLERITYLTPLRDKLIKGLLEKIDRIILTGHPTKRLPGHVSICIEFIEGESMLMFLNMEGIASSSGSACTSRALKASHVLLATGISHEMAHGSLVFSIGINNTEEDIDYVLEALPPIVERLRKMSPLYAKYLKAKGGSQNASLQ